MLHFLILSLAFIALHLVCFSLGMSFDLSPLRCYWQYLDPFLLRERSWESLYYLHSQPPLFNLFLAVGLRFFKEHSALFFQSVFILLAYLSTILLYRSLILFSVGKKFSLVLCLAFLLHPSFVLYENLLFYPWFEVFLILTSVWSLQKLGVSKNLMWCHLFFGALAGLCFLRSLFHLLFFLMSAVLVCIYFSSARREILRACVLPLALVLGLYLKNYFEFGFFGSSSWLGLNLANNLMMVHFKEGKSSLPALLRRKPFTPLSPAEISSARMPNRYAIVPALAEPTKRESLSGTPGFCDANYNHYGYISLSSAYQSAARTYYSAHPEIFLKRLILSWHYFFYPSSRYQRLSGNTAKISAWNELWDRFIFGRITVPGAIGIDDRPFAVYLGLFAGIPVLIGLGCIYLGRVSVGLRLPLAYLLFVIVWVALVGNLLEMPENNRFRFSIDPLFVELLGLVVSMQWRSSKERLASFISGVLHEKAEQSAAH